MDCSFSLSISIKRVADSHARNILWTLAACLASTVIIFGALGSIQNECRNEDPALLADTNGFSGAVLTCKKLYRYYWFITALCIVTSVYALWITARGFLATSRGAVLGLLVVANLLTINMTDAFLTMTSISKWKEGTARDRARTMVAGCIITAVFQSFAIILVGMEPGSCCDAPKSEKTAKTVEEEAPKTETKAVELAPVPEPAPPAAAEPAPVEDVEAAPVAAEEAPAPEAEVTEEPKGEAAVAVSVQ